MTPAAARRAARALLAARRDRRPLPALPADCAPTDVAEGYAVQRAVLTARNEPVAGFKVGATSRAAQDYLPLDGPFYGCVFAAGVHESPAVLAADDFIFRLIEPEFAFRLGADLPPRERPYTPDEVAGAVAAVCPAIEVVTCALGMAWVEAGAPALIADNGVHGAFVIGPETPDWRGLDLGAHEVRLERNGREEGRGVGANALGHPLRALAWLAGRGVVEGRGLKAGDLVTTGVVTPFIYVEAGDGVRADFGALGEVRLDFT